MTISWHKDQIIHQTCAALHRSRENAAHWFTLVQTNLSHHSWENQLSFNSGDWMELLSAIELLLADLNKCNKGLWEFQLGMLARHFILVSKCLQKAIMAMDQTYFLFCSENSLNYFLMETRAICIFYLQLQDIWS